MHASSNGQLDVVNRLLDWEKTQIRKGFNLTYAHGSLYFPVDLIEMVIDFALKK